LSTLKTQALKIASRVILHLAYARSKGQAAFIGAASAFGSVQLRDPTQRVRRIPRRSGLRPAQRPLEGILTFDDVVELLSEELTDLAKLVAKEQKRERDHAVR
jgi:hypothetical protein